MKEQTKEQFIMLYGKPEHQSKTAKACFDYIFNQKHRLEAAEKHGVTVQSMCKFIQNNNLKHSERYIYFSS